MFFFPVDSWYASQYARAVAIGKEKGVYLWAIHCERNYLTYYVGETGVSFVKRSLQHAKNYLNGFYRVYEPEEFAKGK